MWNDLTIGLRSFLRAPRFTVPALLALALGIGSTSAIFSVVNGVVLRPLPYQDPDRIVVVWENNLRRNRPRNVIAAANFVAWRERNRSFEQFGMVGPARVNLVLDGRPEEVPGLLVSSAVFPALGVTPALGRPYGAAEDDAGHDQVVVLGYDFWRTRFGGRANVLNTTVVANGVPRTIVGVMPPDFTIVGEKADVMIPYGWTIEGLRTAPGRGASHGIARLREGVSLEQAASEMTNIAAQLSAEAPRRNTGWSVTLVSAHEQTVDQIRPALLILAGAVALVLLIACVNVANLLVARIAVRQRELGIRGALGAGRARLVRQMLTESLLLGLAGGSAGLALAYAFHRGLLALAAGRIPVPRLEQVSMDLPVLAFTIGLALTTALLFGVAPALMASSGALTAALGEGGRHGTGLRSRRVLGALVVAEVALSLVLLAGAGLLIRSFIQLQRIDPGFRADGVLTARVQLPGISYDDDRRSAGFFSDVVARVAAAPGVRSAAGVSFLPLTGPGIGTGFSRADRPAPAAGDALSVDVKPVTPGFFRTMGIPQLAGRDFAASDRDDTPRVAIVSDTLAREQFRGESPIGKRLNVAIGRPDDGAYEIVGVVGDIRMTSLDTPVRAAVYLPHTQLAIGLMTFVIRTDGDPRSLVVPLRDAVNASDREIPLAEVQTMAEVVDATLSRPRAVMVLLAAFALMALLLAAVGVYGVMAYAVGQRTQEIGVRMALGATAQSVFRMVLGDAFRLVMGGIAAGLVAAAALTRLLDALLFETPALDPWTFAATAGLLLGVAMLASFVPARRGTRLSPVEALRTE